MTGKTGSNFPRGREPMDKVRQMQRRLWASAKRQSGRRFHALYDRIYRNDVLWEAWKRVRRNRGAAGVDALKLADIEQGVGSFLERLGNELREGKYRTQAVKRRYIPKADGKKRPLGIPTVRDRVVQMAAKLVLALVNHLRLATPQVPEGQTEGTRPEAQRAATLNEQLLPQWLWSPSSRRHYPIPGGCVMHGLERPPVSRVREIRMHGLKGGLALSSVIFTG